MKENAKKSGVKNNSTISLHIAAYENSAEAASDDSIDGGKSDALKKAEISVFENWEKRFIIENPFEFPRQQENGEATRPEVSKFKTSQGLLNTNSSTGKRGRPKGSVDQKTVYNESRRENALQKSAASVLESMNEQQLLYYNLSVTETEKVQRELDEEKLRSQELQKQMSSLQKLNQQQAEQIETEKASRQVAVENYEREKEQRKTAEQKCQNEINERKIDEKNHKQAINEMQRTAALEKKESAKQILTLEKNVAHLKKANDEQHTVTKEEKDKNKEMVRKLGETEKEAKNLLILNDKLQEALNEMASTNRSLKINIDEYQNNLNQLQMDYEKVSKNFCNLKETSKTPKRKLPSLNKSQVINTQRHKPYNLSSARTQQRRVQKNVQELKEVPDMAKKVLARFQQKTENKKHKITPLQTVAMAVIVGFNPNQLENMKSLLRFFKMDILPPVHLIRKTLKTLKEDFQYIEFEDKELGVVGRQVSDIKNVIKLRAERLIESGRWVDVPGFEGYIFIGLSADSGGGFLQCAVSHMNVDENWGSPNNTTIVATGKIKTENYETVKYICGDSFSALNEIDGKEMEFQVNEVTVNKIVLVICCFDGKIGSICSGHCGASSAMPCYSCVLTKTDINNGTIGELRNAVLMLQQALQFEGKKAAAKAPTEAFLSKLRFECKCITKPPLLTIPYTQWIYGVLHAIMGPTIKTLDIIEDNALQQDLKDLKIDIQSSKELRKANKELSAEIGTIKSHIVELNQALKLSKTILPKWKQMRRKSVEGQGICGSKYCLQNLLGAGPLFSAFLKCDCGTFIHASCDLLFTASEIEYAQTVEYSCPSCDPVSSDAAINDLISRQSIWETEISELKELLKDKEKESKESKVQIPYDRCVLYQQIQLKYKEYGVHKNLYFQKLNGVDVRKLIKRREDFVSVVGEEIRDDVKSLFECLNTYQELAQKQFLSDADIDLLNPEELKRAYKAICGDEVPPKVHHLCDHSPKFMKKFHFYQLVNDHAIEHVHRICKVLLQKMCINKDDPQKSLKTITDHFCIRNKLFDLGINIDSLRTLSIEEKQKLINDLNVL